MIVSFFILLFARFYGLNIRTNFAHYHLFVVLSLPAYYVCAYMSVIKVTTLLMMIKYSSLTYRLVAIRVRKLAQFTTPQQQDQTAEHKDVKLASIEKIVQLHEKAFQYVRSLLFSKSKSN